MLLFYTIENSENAATTYNLALLQETLEVIGEDIVMFITNKLNGGDNNTENDDDLYDTADEQPDGIEDDEDDEHEENPTEDEENSSPETDAVDEEKKEAEGDDENETKPEGEADEKDIEYTTVDVIKPQPKPKPQPQPDLDPKSEGRNKKYVSESKKSKEPLTKIKGDLNTKGGKQPNEEVDTPSDTETVEGNEEEEPDMAEDLASVAINVAAQKFKEQLGRLNIQL